MSSPPVGSSHRERAAASAGGPPPRRPVTAAEVALRPAEARDSRLIWIWRNDPETRAASFDTAEIPWSAHERWFADSLGRADRSIYLVLVAEQPQGTVRLDFAGSEATVGINLAAGSRGRGVGPIALGKLAELAWRRPGLSSLVASIKDDNATSLSCFRKARFSERGRSGGVVTVALARPGSR